MSNNIDIIAVVIGYLCLLFSLCIHEAAHAAMANYFGDPTGRLLGRISLNPVRHADRIGTVALPLVGMFTGFPFLIGWAKPVPFNPRNLSNVRRDPVFIALAGPGANLTAALGGALVLRTLATIYPSMPESPAILLVILLFQQLIGINVLLAIFNAIPLPPLDGYHVLDYFLPQSARETVERIGPYSTLILLLLLFQFNILDLPMRLLMTGIHYIAFYGTPLF